MFVLYFLRGFTFCVVYTFCFALCVCDVFFSFGVLCCYVLFCDFALCRFFPVFSCFLLFFPFCFVLSVVFCFKTSVVLCVVCWCCVLGWSLVLFVAVFCYGGVGLCCLVWFGLAMCGVIVLVSN